MRVLKIENKAAAFYTTLVNYGKLLDQGIYKIELNTIANARPITIYRSAKKPILRDIYFIGLFWLPFYLLLIGLGLVILLILFITSFYEQCLFKKSFIVRKEEYVSGYISLTLSVIGLISIINRCYNLLP